jgi:hypothetical protein
VDLDPEPDHGRRLDDLLFVGDGRHSGPGEDPATNAFTIEVNGIQADPTVVIKRGGTANNLVVGSGPKQG